MNDFTKVSQWYLSAIPEIMEWALPAMQLMSKNGQDVKPFLHLLGQVAAARDPNGYRSMMGSLG